MTTYTVISDVHANYPALEAVLADSPKTDGVICLGDMVGLYGFPQETVSTLRDVTTYCLRGNHDVAVLDYQEGHVNSHELSMFELDHTWELLDQDEIDWVNRRFSYLEIEDEGLLMAHAKPNLVDSDGYSMGNSGIPKGWFTKAASNVPEWVDIVLLGHTHDQHGLDCERFDHDVVVINPGSVGQPLDGHAEYATIDTDDGSFELHQTDFDGERVISRLRELDVPFEWWR